MSYFTPPAYIFPDNFQNLIFSKDAMDLKVCNTSLFSMLHPNLPWSSSTALIAPDYVWSSQKSKRVQSPLQINAAMCVSQFTYPLLSRLLQSSQVTTLCISHDHISMIIISEVFISGKKFWVYKFTVSHFFFIYNNDPNSSHHTSHTLSFQLPPLLVALLVPRAIP